MSLRGAHAMKDDRGRGAVWVCARSSVLMLALSFAMVGSGSAAQLGEFLTPIGAERAGNASGTIPPWEGGLDKKVVERGYNPFSKDEPLYIITAENADDYATVLTEGHRALFKRFPKTYRMLVYPTRRSASYPAAFYDETIKNAKRVSLNADGHGFCCTARGFPFPIPKSGREVIWNHVMRYNTHGYHGHVNHAITSSSGDFTMQRTYLELSYVYNNPRYTAEEIRNRNVFVLFNTLTPRHKAGDVILLHIPIDRVNEKEMAWVFNRGRGRVQAVTEIGYDNPIYDALMTHDQVDMFNGPMDRYDMVLIGKQEMLVPYNSYRLYDPEVKYTSILAKGHINQDHARYELHRVWVVDAVVKKGYTHNYRRRRFYLDEDSWLVLAQDIYDDRDEFWRFAEAHPLSLPSVPIIIAGEPGVQVHYDLQKARYVVLNLTNEEPDFIEYDWEKHPDYFTPQRLRDFGIGKY